MKIGTYRTLLIGLVVLPVVYFGIQLLLAPAYPGYSLWRDPTSGLGSDRSPVALWFNAAAIAGGMAGIAGSWGAYRAFEAAGGRARALILPIVMAMVAAGFLWAGIFPLPHPLHPMNPSTPAMLITPVLALIYAWWAPALRPLRVVLLVNLTFFLAVLPFMIGLVPVDRGTVGGLLQRLLALPVFLPIGLIGWQLRRAMPVLATRR